MSDDIVDKQQQVSDLQCDLLEAHCDALNVALDNRLYFSVYFNGNGLYGVHSEHSEVTNGEDSAFDLVDIETFENTRQALLAACRLARILKRREKP